MSVVACASACARRIIARWRSCCCWPAAAPLRLGYSQAPTSRTGGSTATSTSTPSRRRACARRIADWFRWHRRTQLPDYAELLAQRAAADPARPSHPPSGVPLGATSAQRASTPRYEHGVPALAERRAHAHAGAAAAHRAALPEGQRRVPRATSCRPTRAERLERADQAHGRARRDALRPARRRAAQADRAHGVAASPFDAERWLAERQRAPARDRSTPCAALHGRARADAGAHQAGAARACGARRSARRAPAYRAYQQRLNDYNCALAARAAQRHDARAAAPRAGAPARAGKTTCVRWRRSARTSERERLDRPEAAQGDSCTLTRCGTEPRCGKSFIAASNIARQQSRRRRWSCLRCWRAPRTAARRCCGRGSAAPPRARSAAAS